MPMLKYSLAKVLSQTIFETTGGGEAKPYSVKQLKADLDFVEKNNRVLLAIAVSMIVVLFVALLVALFFNLPNPQSLKYVTAGFGVSFPILVGWMLRLWRERYYTRVILVICARLGEKDLRMALDGIRKTYMRSGTGA